MFDTKKYDALAYAIGSLSALGMAFMAYLTYLHYSSGASTLCHFSAKLSCDLVNRSLFSELAGIPVAVLGFAYFLAMAVLAFRTSVRNRFQVMFFLTLLSLPFSLYLSTIEFFVLGVVCLFCELSKVLMLVILALSAVRMRGDRTPFRIPWIAGALVLSLVMSGAAYVLQA